MIVSNSGSAHLGRRLLRAALLLACVAILAPAPTAAQDPAGDAGQAVAAGEDDATGTDPRAFGTKFMPYVRYTELENDIEDWAVTLFGLVRITDDIAMTYEIPIAKETDVSDFDGFKTFRRGKDAIAAGMSPPRGFSEEFPALGSGTITQVPDPFSGFGPDGETFGIGDSGFRLFYKNDALRFDSPFRGGSGEIMLGGELVVPTATKDVLGGDTWVLSPLLVLVLDMPLPFSFLAAMNFYDFDIHKKGGGGGDVSRYRGRWFYMQPLSPPGDKWYNGIYLLPEFQPVYDFKTDHFSFWVGPEIGKILSEGRIFYLKPGFGVDPDGDLGDRDWTFEVGFRYFF